MADRRYETLVVIHPDQGEPGVKELAARIRKLIEEQGGTIGDLAYVVAKQHRAFYLLFEYRATSKALAEIERNLKLTDSVLRLVSVRQAENAPPTPPRTVRRFEREDGEPEGADRENLGEEMP